MHKPIAVVLVTGACALGASFAAASAFPGSVPAGVVPTGAGVGRMEAVCKLPPGPQALAIAKRAALQHLNPAQAEARLCSLPGVGIP